MGEIKARLLLGWTATAEREEDEIHFSLGSPDKHKNGEAIEAAHVGRHVQTGIEKRYHFDPLVPLRIRILFVTFIETTCSIYRGE